MPKMRQSSDRNKDRCIRPAIRIRLRRGTSGLLQLARRRAISDQQSTVHGIFTLLFHMKIALLAFTLLAAVVAVSAVPTQLTYKAGDFLSYSFASQVQTGTQSASGALSTMSGTVEVECQEINNAGNYLFAINMFDVVVNAQNPPGTLLCACLSNFF